ncbi:MAG: protoglobin domain-containing protein [Gemmataceae bacterium]
MSPEELFARYQELQSYVGWEAADADRVAALRAVLEPAFDAVTADFYAEIERHEGTRRVLRAGDVDRLKVTLRAWLADLFAGQYDQDYVVRRRRIGMRHVEIGLEPVYMNVAVSRLRGSLVRASHARWTGSADELTACLRALHRLLDLDLAIIEDAYQTENVARLQRHERLAAIGQVAGGVAHELRNPLNVVKTSVYYLLNARNPVPEKQAEHLQRIERHVTLADGIITALTNFARLPVPVQQAVPARGLVERALDANPVGAQIAVTLEFPPALPDVLADPDQMLIVFANLIRNARDAMPDGGRLTVCGCVDGERVEVAVTDTGVGIPADRLKQILEPLYSTKARGLGLGLAIARAILEKNQGELRVASTPGDGSTFTVFLPRAPAGPEPPLLDPTRQG